MGSHFPIWLIAHDTASNQGNKEYRQARNDSVVLPKVK
jgi:hypothetical protein